MDRALDSALAEGGYTGRPISFDELQLSADLSDQFRGDPYFGQPGPALAWTVELGVNVNLQFGPVNINGSFGVAVDGSLNIAIYNTVGGGAGAGALGSAGVQLGWSNAQTVQDLGGLFYNTSSGGGAGPAASWETFTGPSQHGFVVGGAFTAGAGVGGGASAGGSNTVLIPLN
jgi:hypothetical protein